MPAKLAKSTLVEPSPPAPSSSALPLLGAVVMCGFMAILVPNYITARVQRHCAQCKHNLTLIGQALESYAKNNEGHYPESLQALTQPRPRPYLETLPTCPAASTNTYRDYQVAVEPDAFSFSCSGNNHQDSTNWPRYDNREGLVDHP